MDVFCATCQEPWDHHHLLHDLPDEVWDGDDDSSSDLLRKKFAASTKTTIPPMLREDLKEHGWVFGRTIVCILECGCCASNAGEGEDKEKVQERKDLRLEAEALMGDDLDGLISTLTTVDRFAESG